MRFARRKARSAFSSRQIAGEFYRYAQTGVPFLEKIKNPSQFDAQFRSLEMEASVEVVLVIYLKNENHY
jgi:hypothetical protein